MKSLMPSSFRRFLVPLRRGLRRSTFAQVLALVAIWAACEALVRALDVNFPAGVLGMLLLLAALFLRWLQLPAMRRGAEWLMAEMLLFFIPTVPVLLDHPEFLGVLGAKLLLAILSGTAVVMLVTGLVVELCVRVAEKRHER
jgi:holin-like protein